MTSLELARKAATFLDSKKAEKLNVIEVDSISSLADYFVIATGNNNTHVRALADELEERNRQGVSVFEKGTKRIMITGTPMAIPNWKLHHIVETSGAAVVCEEMCTGTRYFENLVEEGLPTLDEQFMALSKRYMKNNCACFTPNPGRVEDILRLAKEYHVDGVIDVNLKFCCLYDTEGYSVERALREAGIPVLGIETDYDDGDSEQLRTRIGAFVEMLG